MNDFERIYDLDDTLLHWSISPHYWWKKHFWIAAKNVNKKDVKVILTARNNKDAELTWASVKRAGYTNVHTIFFNPEKNWSRKYVISWKAKMLYWLEVREYIDNDEALNHNIKYDMPNRRLKCLTTFQIKE